MAFSQKVSYHAVKDKDEEDEFGEGLNQETVATISTDGPQKWYLKRFWKISFLLCIIGIVMLTSVSGLKSLRSATEASSPPPEHRPCVCGNSTTMARSMGCKFDLLASAWLPPHCRDDELSAEFDTSGPGMDGAWSLYSDRNATLPLSLEQVGLLADTHGVYHATWEFHYVHCEYHWRKLARAAENGTSQIEDRATGRSHIEHCLQMMRERGSVDPQGIPLATVARVALGGG